MRFIADCNVGKLAKWLRVLGYDTLFDPAAEDEELLDRARRESRVLLTRDHGLAGRRAVRRGEVRALLIESDRWQEQLTQVVGAVGLDPDRGVFTRCLRCNIPLEEQRRERVEALVPAYVYATQGAFRDCPQCGRVYWQGTHRDHVRETLGRLKSYLGAASRGTRTTARVAPCRRGVAPRPARVP